MKIKLIRTDKTIPLRLLEVKQFFSMEKEDGHMALITSQSKAVEEKKLQQPMDKKKGERRRYTGMAEEE
jgi:hypothetical protein